MRRRSASDTRTGSGVGTGLKPDAGGGGIVVGSNVCWEGVGSGNEDGEGIGVAEFSNFMRFAVVGGFDSTDAIEGCVASTAGLTSRTLLLSDVYMTATLVEGEFMVPVSDHPIATGSLARLYALKVVLAYLD